MRPENGTTSLGGKLTENDIRLMKKTLKKTFGTQYGTMLDTVYILIINLFYSYFKWLQICLLILHVL